VAYRGLALIASTTSAAECCPDQLSSADAARCEKSAIFTRKRAPACVWFAAVESGALGGARRELWAGESTRAIIKIKFAAYACIALRSSTNAVSCLLVWTQTLPADPKFF
jgi:hypothetical protein